MISFLLIAFGFSSVFGAFEMPKNLTSSDRKEVLRVLGFGTASRVLSQPIPLGGFEGFEVGLSSEFIPIDDLTGLGSKTNSRGEFNILAITLAKGLPYNIDTAFHFAPQPQNEGIMSYGGQLRWGFWEFEKFPALLSLNLHGSGSNFSSLLNARTTGTDLLLTVQMEEGSIYFGGGPVRTIGSFTGGPGGVTAEGASAAAGTDGNSEEDLSEVRTLLGLGFRLESFFVVVEVSRVTQSTYAAKIGFRF